MLAWAEVRGALGEKIEGEGSGKGGGELGEKQGRGQGRRMISLALLPLDLWGIISYSREP